MADPIDMTGLDALLASMEYLLEARHRQLADAVTEASHRGDLEWGKRLRAEVDHVSSLLQELRSVQERIIGPPS